MKKIFATILVLISVSCFAEGFAPLYIDDLDGKAIVNPQEIYLALTTDIASLQNPHCLAFNIRRSDENLDLRFSTGQYISSLFFKIKIITVENRPVEVLAVTVGFKDRVGINSGSINFNCRTTNSIMDL